MTKYSFTILAGLIATFLITSCNTKKTLVLSKFSNGKPQETIELNQSVSSDSLGLKKVYFENGNLQAVGQSKNGKRQGEWICYFSNGKPEWKAFYKDDIENGEVICYKENGDWRKSNLTNGIRDGKTVSYFYDYFDSTYCYEYGQYVNGLEQGLWTKTDTSGTLLIEMTYVDGETKGYFTNRYKNGKLRLTGEMKEDGSMENFKFYDENGVETKQNSYTLRKI